jgi:hypothetical protein
MRGWTVCASLYIKTTVDQRAHEPETEVQGNDETDHEEQLAALEYV